MKGIITIGGHGRKKFIGHRVRLTSRHPELAGSIGVYVTDNKDNLPLVQIEGREAMVVITKSLHWELA